MKNNKKVSEVLETKEYIDYGFDDILELSKSCRFPDCTHTTEPDCAVIKAISNGHLSEERLNSYLKEKNEAEYVTQQRNKTKAIDYMKQLKLFERPNENN
jgi:putative ribosome biogenesis GTPase RsgA